MYEHLATKADLTELRQQMDRRFDEHDQRFEKIDQRFDEHDHILEKIERRFDRMDLRFDELERRLSWEIAHAINAGVEHIATVVRAVDDKYSDVPEQIRLL